MTSHRIEKGYLCGNEMLPVLVYQLICAAVITYHGVVMYNQHTFVSSQLIKMVSLVSGEGCSISKWVSYWCPKRGWCYVLMEKGTEGKKVLPRSFLLLVHWPFLKWLHLLIFPQWGLCFILGILGYIQTLADEMDDHFWGKWKYLCCLRVICILWLKTSHW